MNLEEQIVDERLEEIMEKYQAIKLEEDLFIVPAHVASSEEFDRTLFSKEKVTGSLKEALEKLQVGECDTLTVTCSNHYLSTKDFEIINLKSGKIAYFSLKTTLEEEDREALVNLIACWYEGKSVVVTYNLPYNLEGLLNLE